MKLRSLFICQVCGYSSPKWMGRCPDCSGWNTMAEEAAAGINVNRLRETQVSPLILEEIKYEESDRFLTGIEEFDRVLGGGIVPGSVVLIGGDPGIGKSTLLLQVAERIGRESKSVLYISGEESPSQIKMRAERLCTTAKGIYILSETSVEEILRHIQKTEYSALIVDSIQTTFTSGISSAPGSVSQVREVAAILMNYAKKSCVPVFIVGHVTKDGSIAGPRVLEHIVDTVLYFEGDRGHPYRILRSVKNRFGSTHEIGVFEMKEGGLEEVLNPSSLFLSERTVGSAGSVVVSSLEGSRPILTEIQALVSPSPFGIPKRGVIGVDYNRLLLLVAVLDKRVGMHIQGQDIFVNVVGGLELSEPASDLGIIAALSSSFKEIPVDPYTVVFGEVGLSGEVRGVTSAEIRVKEAAKLGFRRCIIPERNATQLAADSVDIIGVSTVKSALEIMFS
ncbi:MAG: DNA repair protein RadA [Nitrospirae bacterium]|nr:DNA repair protein RadA [Nitrospirota bacterium]